MRIHREKKKYWLKFWLYLTVTHTTLMFIACFTMHPMKLFPDLRSRMPRWTVYSVRSLLELPKNRACTSFSTVLIEMNIIWPFPLVFCVRTKVYKPREIMWPDRNTQFISSRTGLQTHISLQSVSFLQCTVRFVRSHKWIPMSSGGGKPHGKLTSPILLVSGMNT